MKKTIIVSLYFILIKITLFAQHEHHQMQMPAAKPTKNNVQLPKNKAVAGVPTVVHYDLYVRDTMVNFGNKTKRAIAVNGQIPMPTLTFTEGDTAEIYVHNELNEETSLHWHGLILPNQYDGVPNLTDRKSVV